MGPQDLWTDAQRQAWLARDLSGIRIGVVVAAVILSYDYILTVGREVNHFWLLKPGQRPYNWSRFLFFINRYFPLAFGTVHLIGSNGAPRLCSWWIRQWLPVTAIIQTLIVQCIVSQRLYCLYNAQLRIQLVSYGILIFTTTTSILLTAIAFTRKLHVPAQDHASTLDKLCAHTLTDLNWAAWIPVVGFFTAAMGLALNRTYHRILEDGKASQWENKEYRRLFGLMFRNSILYISVLLAMALAHLFALRFGSRGHIFQGPSQSVITVIGSRLCIHAKEARYGKFAWDEETLEEMQFVEGPAPRVKKRRPESEDYSDDHLFDCTREMPCKDIEEEELHGISSWSESHSSATANDQC